MPRGLKVYSRINYTLVGLFVILFTAGMLLFGFWLAKYGFEKRYDCYMLYFLEPVDGLNIDSSVKLNGVDVGKVKSIEVDRQRPERTAVKVCLHQGTPITADMYGTLKLQGITGLSYVEIRGGAKGSPLLQSDGEKPAVIPVKRSMFYALTSEAPDMMEKLSNAIDGLNRVLSKENTDRVASILENTDRVVKKALLLENSIDAKLDELNETIKTAAVSVKDAGDSLDDMGRRIDSVVKNIEGLIPDVMQSVDDTGKEISRLAKRVEKSFERGDYDLKKIIRPIRIDIDELSYRYQELAEDLKKLSENPSEAIFGGSSLPKGPGE